MSVAEMKLSAIRQISNMDSEEQLKEILAHLAKLDSEDPSQSPFTAHALDIVRERSELLKRLAQ